MKRTGVALLQNYIDVSGDQTMVSADVDVVSIDSLIGQRVSVHEMVIIVSLLAVPFAVVVSIGLVARLNKRD